MSDEKTRIIPRSKAEAVDPAAPPPPQRIGDKIVFFCPNGDKVVVPAKYAGKRGLCTKCKVPVVIPNPPGGKRAAKPVFPGEEPAAEPEAAPAEELAVEAAPEAGEAAAAGEPPPLEVEAESPPATPPPGPPAEEWKFVAEVEGSHAGFEPQSSGPTESWPPPPPFGDAGQPGEHPAARLAARLWMERDHGGIFELHLSGGSVILPEWYDPNWSRGSHGLFASQAADGSVTLTAVAWDTIEKIVVRQMPAVPDGMFE